MRKTNKKLLAAAINSGVYGVDAIAAAGTTTFMLTTGLDITPIEGDDIDRNLDNGQLGNSLKLQVGNHVTAKGSIEITGAGTATGEPAWSPILTAAGFSGAAGADSFIYSRVTDNTEKDATFYIYRDGALHKITGARLNLTYTLSVGKLPTMDFEITGLYAGISQSAIPAAPTFDGFQTPVEVGATYTTILLNGYELATTECSINETNTVSYDENTKAEDVAITDFKPTGKITAEAPTLDLFDPFALSNAGNAVSLVITHGTAAGNIFQITANVQMQRPEYADINGKLAYSLAFDVIGTDYTIATK